MQIHLQVFISSPFKRGTGGFYKKTNWNIFLTITIRGKIKKTSESVKI